jgi:hypothetical protein
MRRRVRRYVFVAAVAFFSPALTCAEDEPMHDDHEMRVEALSPNYPPITISINPEARISVILGGSLPSPATCGAAADLSVKIVNQGLVTARLEAKLVGDVPAGVKINFHSGPLKGVPEEFRTLRITLTEPGPTDLTVAFRAHAQSPDLGGRDRVHFLMHCVESLNTRRPPMSMREARSNVFDRTVSMQFG